MKVLDYMILAIFVVALIVCCFLQRCKYDIYFLILGFAVAAIAAVAMVVQGRKRKTGRRA